MGDLDRAGSSLGLDGEIQMKELGFLAWNKEGSGVTSRLSESNLWEGGDASFLRQLATRANGLKPHQRRLRLDTGMNYRTESVTKHRNGLPSREVRAAGRSVPQPGPSGPAPPRERRMRCARPSRAWGKCPSVSGLGGGGATVTGSMSCALVPFAHFQDLELARDFLSPHRRQGSVAAGKESGESGPGRGLSLRALGWRWPCSPSARSVSRRSCHIVTCQVPLGNSRPAVRRCRCLTRSVEAKFFGRWLCVPQTLKVCGSLAGSAVVWGRSHKDNTLGACRVI